MSLGVEQQAQVIADVSETFLSMESLAKLGSDSFISPEHAVELAPALLDTVLSERHLPQVDLTIQQVAEILLITQKIIGMELRNALKYRNFLINEMLQGRIYRV